MIDGNNFRCGNRFAKSKPWRDVELMGEAVKNTGAVCK